MSSFLDNLKSSWSSAIKIDPKNPKVQSESTSKVADETQMSESASTEEKIKQNEEKLKPAQLASKMFGMAIKASSKLQEKATNISAIVNERTIIGNIEKERQKFIGELQREGKCPDDIGMGELLANPEAQKHIVAISMNRKNFTEDPPMTMDLDASMVVVKSYANALFELDPRLKSVRFELVPKEVCEEKFWRRYTYRILLIRKFLEENPAEMKADKPKESEDKTEKGEKAITKKGSEDDEEQLEKELLNDLDEFEMVGEGKKDEELDKEIDALLEN